MNHPDAHRTSPSGSAPAAHRFASDGVAIDYPAPPFPQQQQAWPGLVSQMSPRPDHGETSYQGAGRLQGRKALITGGDSGIGRAAAIAYAREGADVAINYLPAEQIAHLPRLKTSRQPCIHRATRAILRRTDTHA